MKKAILAVVFAASAAVAGVHAQQAPVVIKEHRAAATQDVQAVKVAIDQALNYKVQLAVETRVTRGAPYSAEATTESVQVLQDGNRIVRRAIMRVYRDNEGRTRRETINPDDGMVQSVTISDPVAKTAYTLDPANRTVAGGGMFVMVRSTKEGSGGAESGEVVTYFSGAAGAKVGEAPPVAAAQGGAKTTAHVAWVGEGEGGAKGPLKMTFEAQKGPKSETTKEDLGQQSIDGVLANGTRTTTVIPAGAVGNEQPIKVVSEEWFSPELEVLVLTRHSDPRVGDTTYRLTNIVRTEPDRSLFEVPGGYTVK